MFTIEIFRRLCAVRGQEAGVIENACDRFHVVDIALVDHVEQGLEGQRLILNALIGIGIRWAGGESGGAEGDHALADEAGSGENVHHFHEFFRAVAGFFGEFAAGACERAFAGLHASGDDFKKIIANGVAILADHDDAAVAEDGQQDDGAAVGDDVARGFDAAGLDDDVLADSENFAGIENFAGKQFGARLGQDASVSWRDIITGASAIDIWGGGQ